MKLVTCGIALLLLLYITPTEAAIPWSPMILTEQSPLAILQIPETIDVTDGFVIRVDVVVGNEGLEALNVTLSVEQDRSPHDAFPVDPLPSAVIGAASSATLVLRLLGVISYDALESPEWVGSVSTGVFVRAMTVDGNVSSDAELITVRISFLRLTPTVLAAFGMICLLIFGLCLSVRRIRHVEVRPSDRL
ncbi:MAG: hypothetical protein ACXACG_09500 [Candidatus Thorarchaeota archaeon]